MEPPPSLNITPAKGVNPQQATIELRALLRNVCQRILDQKPQKGVKAPLLTPLQNLPPGPTPAEDSQYNDGLTWWGRGDMPAVEVENARNELSKMLVELNEIAKFRKPSLIRAKIRDEILPKLDQMYAQSRESNRWKSKGFTQVRDLLQYKLYLQPQQATPPPPPPPPVENQEEMERAYALVQVIPITDGAPNGHLESAMRAIEAIIKTQHNVDVLDSFDAVPTPPTPIILVQYVKEEKEEEEVIALPSFALPFGIGSISRWTMNTLREAPKIDNGLGHPEDKIADVYARKAIIERFNNGDCTLAEALEAVKVVRSRWTAPMWLKDSNGQEILRIGENEKVPTVEEISAKFAGKIELAF